MAISEINSLKDFLSYNTVGKTVTKIALIGDSEVGKTSLLKKLFDTNFSSSYNKTLGFNVMTKKLPIDDNNSRILTFLDFSGQKKLIELRKACYLGIDIIFAICDVTRRETLIDIENFWIPEFMSIQSSEMHSDTIFQIIGTKADLGNNIMLSLSDLDRTAKRIAENYPTLEIGGPSIITSAKKKVHESATASSFVNTKFLFLS